ncbi:MAG: twin-arginine translocase subunit TatC [Myxococcus sp.]|nr:twin-arginine translocase subunit TatC [Myxococcus sp.]
MSLFEHLAELRTRLMRVVIAVVVLGAVSLAFAREIYGFLMRPVLMSLPAASAQLIYTSAIEELNVLMKIGLYAGVFMSTPVLLWQIWGFISPGLYDNEKKLAAPFIVFGTLAFVAGAAFCYFALLPQMFSFLLQREDVAAITQRIDTAKLREQDALRYLSLGDLDHAAALARTAVGDLEAAGEGRTTSDGMGVSLLPKRTVDVTSRLEGLGRLVDATRAGFGESARPVLSQVMAKRLEAIAAYGLGDLDKAQGLADEGAALLAGVVASRTADFAELWKLERTVSVGVATVESMNWTKPMLSMSEQLSLVLVLELAFGLIFELPLVMMVLGMVGLVKSSFLFKYQRHALVVCLIAAAILTPTGDAVNLALMAGPMLLCYELGVVLVWVVEKRRRGAPADATGITPT